MSMIQLTDVTFHYPGSYDNVFEHASVRFDTRWKLGLTGRNGRGKTTLLRLLQGELPCEGQITAAVDFCRFPCPVPDAARPLGEVAAALYGAEDWRIARELGLLGLGPETLARRFDTLSQGEQTRALLQRTADLIRGDHPQHHCINRLSISDDWKPEFGVSADPARSCVCGIRFSCRDFEKTRAALAGCGYPVWEKDGGLVADLSQELNLFFYFHP